MGEVEGVSEACEICQVVPQTQGAQQQIWQVRPTEDAHLHTCLGNLTILEGHGKGPKPRKSEQAVLLSIYSVLSELTA